MASLVSALPSSSTSFVDGEDNPRKKRRRVVFIKCHQKYVNEIMLTGRDHPLVYGALVSLSSKLVMGII